MLAASNPKRKLTQKWCSLSLPPPSLILATCSNGLTGAATHMSLRVWVGLSSNMIHILVVVVKLVFSQFSFLVQLIISIITST